MGTEFCKMLGDDAVCAEVDGSCHILQLDNPCFSCGHEAGREYFSDYRTDTGEWKDVALVLCERCAAHGDALPDDDALAFFRNGVQWGGAGPAWARKRY